MTIIAKIAFYDDVCSCCCKEILNTKQVIQDDDIEFGSLNQSLIMLSHRLELPLELLENCIERIEWI